MKLDEQKGLDAHWHQRLKPLLYLVGETYDVLMPPSYKLEAAAIAFHESGGQMVPDLYPIIKNQAELEEAHDRLGVLKREIAEYEPNHGIRDAYMHKIHEMLANVDMIIAAGERHDKLFASANKFVYGAPDPAVFGAACAWVRSEAARVSNERPELQAICDRVLAAVPDISGDISLLFPDSATFQKVKDLHFAPGGFMDQLMGGASIPNDAYVTAKQGDSLIMAAIEHVGSTFKLVDSPTGLWAYLPSQQTVVRPPDFMLSKPAFYGIVAHEVGSHLLELENGRRSSLKLLEFGMDRYEAGTEGRAFLREQIMYGSIQEYVSQLLWHPTKASWEYRVAIHMIISLAMGLGGRAYTFADAYYLLSLLFRFWTLQRGGEIDETKIAQGAWSMAVRVFKGTSGVNGAYLKDIVYLEGHVRCWQTAKDRPELILLGDVGKFDITNPGHILLLEQLGILPNTHNKST